MDITKENILNTVIDTDKQDIFNFEDKAQSIIIQQGTKSALIDAVKAKNWAAVTANVAIEQENLVGIIISGGGSLVLIGSDGTSELNLGTVTADMIAILPFCPTKVKTGSTATVIAVYGG